MTETARDAPGVIVFPPLVPLTVLVVGGLLDWLLPIALLNALPLSVRALFGIVLFAAGLALAISGERAFKRAGTNVNPFRPSLAVASGGIYNRLRNPMYVGMGFALGGIAFTFALEWTLALGVVGALVIHFGVVLREERYLEHKFGDEYRSYKERVPRYGAKF